MRTDILFVTTILLLIITISTAMAATVDLVNPRKLPDQIKEGEHIDFTIKIYDYEDTKSIMIETSLIPSDNKPVFDFGDLNPSMSQNRYNSTITIDTFNIPKTVQVSISGKVPEGETTENYGDIIVTKFRDPKLKYYDVHADKKDVAVEPFDLIIEKKKTFDDTMEQINRPELNNIKREINNLFDKGLVGDAQDIVNDLNAIKWPNSLSLFGLINIDNSFWLNIMTIVILIIGIFIGFIIKGNIDDNEDD